ncbi:MAG: hypothetical protein AABY53_06080 [Bdellovibrionota bacterium]
MWKFYIIFIISFSLQSAQAFLLDINSGILQGSFNRASEQSNSKSVNSLGLYANLANSDSNLGVNIGWFILLVSNKENYPPTVSQTLSSNDMGPALRWQIDRGKKYSLTLAYGIICKGNFNDGVTEESLSGESYLLKFAIEPEIADRYFVGVGLNYYVASYKTRIVTSIQSDAGYKNTVIFPSLSFSYRY